MAAKALFCPGELVEVASGEEGFVGSYFEATVVSKDATGGGYIVQYKTLVKDDGSGPLREVAPAAEIRPRPPKVVAAAGFHYGDVVDAFDNEGWWVGKVTGRIGDHFYCVFFEAYGVTLTYHMNHLRLHQDWILAGDDGYNRVWVCASDKIKKCV